MTDSRTEDGVHGARLTVDLGAIAANWRALAARGPGAECAAVVKADAYGCGLDRVGPALWRAGCRTIFVAHLTEGVAARACLPEAAIYVLNGLPPGAARRSPRGACGRCSAASRNCRTGRPSPAGGCPRRCTSTPA